MQGAPLVANVFVFPHLSTPQRTSLHGRNRGRQRCLTPGVVETQACQHCVAGDTLGWGRRAKCRPQQGLDQGQRAADD
jgi:hypothetical protein